MQNEQLKRTELIRSILRMNHEASPKDLEKAHESALTRIGELQKMELNRKTDNSEDNSELQQMREQIKLYQSQLAEFKSFQEDPSKVSSLELTMHKGKRYMVLKLGMDMHSRKKPFKHLINFALRHQQKQTVIVDDERASNSINNTVDRMNISILNKQPTFISVKDRKASLMVEDVKLPEISVSGRGHQSSF